MQKTILISSWFGGPVNKNKLTFFKQLAKRLTKGNNQLVFLTHDRFELDHGQFRKVPFFPNKYSRNIIALPWFHIDPSELSLALREAVSSDAEYKKINFSTTAAILIYQMRYIKKILRKEKPALVVLWNQFFGIHRLIADTCVNLGIPYIYAEYGVLPGTICFDSGGQMAESWVAQDNEKFLNIPVSDDDLKLGEEYLIHIKKEKVTRKIQSEKNIVKDVVERRRKEGKKIIFYAGQNDYRAGMLPRWIRKADLHSPFFTNTLEVLTYLDALADKNNWHIIFKPHPLYQDFPVDSNLKNSKYIDWLLGANVFDCIEESDLTITILSQVSYLALIHDRPALLLGRNQLSGKGCVYEISSKENIESKVSEALREGFTENQKEKWLLHVAQLLERYVFSFDPAQKGFIKRDIDDVAEFFNNELEQFFGNQAKLNSEDMSLSLIIKIYGNLIIPFLIYYISRTLVWSKRIAYRFFWYVVKNIIPQKMRVKFQAMKYGSVFKMQEEKND